MVKMNEIIPRVVIKETINGTEISINGKVVEGVQKYSVEHEGGKLPVLHLYLIAANMELNEKMIPALPDVFKDFYEPVHKDNSESTQ